MSDQYKDNVRRLLEACQATFGDTFKTYYDGDPEAIPVFNLPCLMVTQTSEETQEGAMGQDDVEDRITIKVVLNKRDDFTNDKVDPLNMTERKIREFVGLRDPETGDYAEQTVKHIVRTLALDGVEAVGNSMTVEYGINPRPGGEGRADLTAEGHVSFGIQYSVDTF